MFDTSFLAITALPGPIKDPVAVFLVLIALLLVTPLVFERLRLPGIVGLIISGVVVGPYGLNLLERDKTIVLLGTVGLLFLMFMAGLETSLDDLKLNARKALIFGMGTFLVPMIIGAAAMRALGYSWLASTLIASCFASHTLLALPIASKLGIMRRPAVTVTLGGTLITNILALLVLAVVVKAHQGSLDISFWLFLIPSLTIYTFLVLWGIPRVGRWFFRKFGHDEGAEFTFVIATLFLVSYAANLIQIEPIIGAFLAGISITPLIPQYSPLMNRIQFIGNTLFIPFFLLSVGMLVNPGILFQDSRSLLVSGVMVVVAIVAKLLPAWVCGKAFKFGKASIMTVFGLSVAQAASTLAAITVAYNIKLVDQLTVNGTIAMILVTCLVSPWVTARWGRSLQDVPEVAKSDRSKPVQFPPFTSQNSRILVPVANPSTEDNLLNLALMLAKSGQGTLLPLHIITENHADISAEDKAKQDRLLNAAEEIAHTVVADVEPVRRVDDAIDKGILRAAYEQNASLIICGWKGFSTYQENFFGSIIDSIVRRARIPVLVTRFTHPIKTTQRVILLISEEDEIDTVVPQIMQLANTLAAELKATLQAIQFVSQTQRGREASVSEVLGQIPVQQVSGRFVNQLLQLLKEDDLLVLNAGTRSNIRRTHSLGEIPEAIAAQDRDISMIIAHIPSI